MLAAVVGILLLGALVYEKHLERQISGMLRAELEHFQESPEETPDPPDRE